MRGAQQDASCSRSRTDAAVFRTTVPNVPPPIDLSLSNSDGLASVKAGAPVSYTIAVHNPSSRTAEDVSVVDDFPPSLLSCTWTCSDSTGSSCTAGGAGDIADAGVAIAAGGDVTYSASCTLAAGATGTLANTATVSYANDPVVANNSATDSDGIVPQANVAIALSDGQSSAKAGFPVTYSIVASNPAAVAVTGVVVADSFPAALSGCAWTCSATSGGSCPAGGSGNIAASITLGATGSATFTASCALASSASGTLTDTATVTYANDPVGANNSASDSDDIVPRADVSVSISDGATLVLPGSIRIYKIVATNPGANALSPVTLGDPFPAALQNCAWTCSAGAGGACPASGTGAIDASVTLGPNAGVTFTATCTVAADASGTLANTATVAWGNDPNGANDSATDTDTLSDQLIFADDFE
jgi:uncharacterized repeat protein (TIGR01451 family)